MPGPAPKPAHLRQRTNRKAGATNIASTDAQRVPKLPNVDKRKWHRQTRVAWRNAWLSPMAGQWLETDADALARLALLWDDFYKHPSADALKEIRLQSALFGLSPLDRSRLQWEVSRAGDAEQKELRSRDTTRRRTGTHDPRHLLKVVK